MFLPPITQATNKIYLLLYLFLTDSKDSSNNWDLKESENNFLFEVSVM